jgi:hypothetical protein
LRATELFCFQAANVIGIEVPAVTMTMPSNTRSNGSPWTA